MKRTMCGALLALACAGACAQIFGPAPTNEAPKSNVFHSAPSAVTPAPAPPGQFRPTPTLATDFRSVVTACANTGKESQEAFDACMRTRTISQPGIPQALQEAVLAPRKEPTYAAPPPTASPDRPVNLFGNP